MKTIQDGNFMENKFRKRKIVKCTKTFVTHGH